MLTVKATLTTLRVVRVAFRVALTLRIYKATLEMKLLKATLKATLSELPWPNPRVALGPKNAN